MEDEFDNSTIASVDAHKPALVASITVPTRELDRTDDNGNSRQCEGNGHRAGHHRPDR
jgi:hypothetical protein